MVLCLLVSIRFQVLFHSPPGVLFTFPSRYLFSIGRQVVFSLGRWSSRFHTEFLVLRTTQVPAWVTLLRLRGYHSLWPAFPRCSAHFVSRSAGPTTPIALALGLGSSRFARRYFGNRFYFLFLQVLRCFSSLGSPLGWRFSPAGCPIRISMVQRLLASYHSFSQLATSFFGP